MKRFASPLIGVLCVIALAVGVVAASAAPSRIWINDFERVGDDQPALPGDWHPNIGTIHRTPSYDTPHPYADGIQSAHGRWHARLHVNNVCPKINNGPNCYGPSTRFGKAASNNPNFPDGGYVTEIDVYLDVPWMTADPTTRYDTRFDWSSAINNHVTGIHRRDFVFNAGTPLTPADTMASPGYWVNASTNATRSGAYPENPCPDPSNMLSSEGPSSPNYCRQPVKITESGWYTFRHYFHLVTIGGTVYLATQMSILHHNALVPGADWTIYTKDDAAGFGGDRYGWFVINEIQDLAVDCVAIHPPGMGHPPLHSRCVFIRGHEGEQCGQNNDSNQAEQDAFNEMNRQRAAASMPALTMNTSSSNSAREHSCDERQHGDVQERGSDGSMSGDRMRAAGVPFLVNAENNNYAEGLTMPEALSTIQSDLLDDPTATANILNPLFTQVGIGAVYIGGEMYLTADFTG